MKKLSTSAQAVLDATYREMDYAPRRHVQRAAAAALLAAVNQVLPEVDTMDAEEWIGQSAWQQAEQSVRFRFLAIAAELDGGND
jgi:hypothetical protein